MTKRRIIEPGQTIGIIGGGQLGRMLTFSAKAMGYTVGILDPQENCPASQVADWHLSKAYDDQLAIDQMAERCDVLTYEFENINGDVLRNVIDKVAIPQGVALLSMTQNRQREKAFLKANDFPTAGYQIVRTSTELDDAISAIGYPAVLKTLTGGYDGHGQIVLTNASELQPAEALIEETACLLEGWVPFEKEVSVMVARNAQGELSVFPVAENTHVANILHLSQVPAALSKTSQEKIRKIAETIATELSLEGILGIEFFIGKNDDIYVNELAPRPHNSGHYSIEACNFSQFDAHILAICNRPLPSIDLLKEAVMINVLGQHQEAVIPQLMIQPNWHAHFYGKEESILNRKMGHITVLTDNRQEEINRLAQLSIW